MPRFLRYGLIACCLGVGSPSFAAGQAAVPLCFERQEVLPWRTLDGGGLNFELLAEVARRLGLVFDYQSMPWKRCLAQVKANQVSGAFAVSFSRERLALGAYPGTHGAMRGDEGQADPDKRMHVDRYVLLAGMLTTAKPVHTLQDEPMEFATFDDGDGLIETVLFPQVYRERGHVLFDQGPFIFRGKVEEEFGAVTVTITHLDRLERAVR